MITIPDALTDNLLRGFVLKGGEMDTALKRTMLLPLPKSLTIHDFVRLCRVIIVSMDDEYVGQNERPQRIGTFSVMAKHVSHADTVGAGFERLYEFLNILDNTFRASYRTTTETAEFAIERKAPGFPVTELGVEMILILSHRLIAWMAGTWLPMPDAWFDYPRPSHHQTYEYLFPGSELSFGKPNSGFSIPVELLSLSLLRNEEQAAGWARRTPLDAFLPVTIADGLSLQVAQIIERALENREALPSMEDVADALNLPTYTLRRRLKREGRDLPEIRHRVRRDFALRLLTEGTEPVGAIGARVGYSETSAFVRAFKGWTGVTPKIYRQSGKRTSRISRSSENE